MAEEDEQDYRNNNICRFCEKETLYGKVRDHCQLPGSYRGPADGTCISNVTQKQNFLIPFALLNFSNSDCPLFLKS